MATLIHKRVRECQAGTYPKLISRVRSGWVVLGDVQFVSGYCLLLPDPVVPHLNAMEAESRRLFLHEMALVGDALLQITGAVRINYEMLGNVEPALHAHLFPRYADEPDALRLKPVWFYDWDKAPAFDPVRDKPLMDTIAAELALRKIAI